MTSAASSSPDSETILDRIVAQKRVEVDRARSQRPEAELRARLKGVAQPRDFIGALRSAPWMGLIAEVKRASPSAGVIRSDFDPLQIAQGYAAAGANCLSVLTDQEFFGGHLDDLKAVRNVVGVPVLRKDFLIDPYQLLEARVAGADAVLLIAECLPGDRLRILYECARDLGLACLIELYDAEHIDRILDLQPALVGVNNRDLRSFQVDLDHTVRLAPRLIPHTLLVAESGIRTRADVLRLRQAGCRALLVGETLMRAESIADKVAELSHPDPVSV